jgi:hypothetical protein
MTEVNKDNKENPTVEKLESVGQLILGEIEKIGGVLTADPIAQAEADLVQDAGSRHLEAADSMEQADIEEHEKKSNPTE